MYLANHLPTFQIINLFFAIAATTNSIFKMTYKKRTSSVSFSKTDPDHPSDLIADEENIQLSLAPHVQTYLSQVSQESGCWGRFLPIPFERAASKSWWDPTFDSEVLEEQYKKSAAPYNRLKFR